MARCLVLGDSAVRGLLINLSRDEILSFASKLAETLRLFSASDERQFQPAPGSIVRPSGQKTLFRPFTSPSSVGTKIIVDPAPIPSATDGNDTNAETRLPLHGILVICDKDGNPTGIINAEEITGFRTSLSALLLWFDRHFTEDILVFGAGKQALWHIRLALAVRGDEVKSITIVNRSLERAHVLVDQLKKENASKWASAATFSVLDTSARGYETALEAALSRADAIFCTVPTEKPLFRQGLLAAERRPYISAIGSWQPNMVELDPALLKRAASSGRNDGESGDVVLVDDVESVRSHSGEVIQSGLDAHQLLELGTWFDRKKIGPDATEISRFRRWLQTGLVVYKSIGVSLTDLAMGEAIIELARQRKQGISIPDL